MPHQRFLLLALTLILGVSVWVVFMNRETAVAPVVEEPSLETPVPTQPITEELLDTSNWKTYRNEKYGFEVKYPSEIYEVEDGGYVTLISFVARNKELKEQYGDIQVLYGDGEGGVFDEQEVASSTRLTKIGDKYVYFDESKKDCVEGVADGYCDIPGSAYIFSGEKSYSIRRITYRGTQLPPARESNFIQFLTGFKVLSL